MKTFGIGLGAHILDNDGLFNFRPYDPSLDGIDININNYNITIEKNEISKIVSDVETSGILINEPGNSLFFLGREFTLLDSIRTHNGPHTDQYTITNNLIYDLFSSDREFHVATRTGIAVCPSIDIPPINSHRMSKALITNNTILIDDVTPLPLANETTIP